MASTTTGTVSGIGHAGTLPAVDWHSAPSAAPSPFTIPAGYIDDVHGWDFAGACLQPGPGGSCGACGARATPNDSDGHGTHIAGIVAAAQVG